MHRHVIAHGESKPRSNQCQRRLFYFVWTRVMEKKVHDSKIRSFDALDHPECLEVNHDRCPMKHNVLTLGILPEMMYQNWMVSFVCVAAGFFHVRSSCVHFWGALCVTPSPYGEERESMRAASHLPRSENPTVSTARETAIHGQSIGLSLLCFAEHCQSWWWPMMASLSPFPTLSSRFWTLRHVRSDSWQDVFLMGC